MTPEADLAERILALDDVELRVSRFSGAGAFFVGERELAHFHPGKVIDVRLTRTPSRTTPSWSLDCETDLENRAAERIERT